MAELLCSPAHRDVGASLHYWNTKGGGLPGLIQRKVDGLNDEWKARGYKVRLARTTTTLTVQYWMNASARRPSAGKDR